LREAVIAVLDQESLRTNKRVLPVSSELHRVETRISAPEHDVLRILARADGISVNRWVVSLIRARLTRTPQLATAEIEALSRSTAALNALGRNLNQIAKALNTHPNGLPAYRLNVMKALEVEIAETRKAIRALLAANLERWNG
jgi:hypothetical protein